MGKATFFLIAIVWGILVIASPSAAQTGYAVEEERGVTSTREADSSVVRVYGPERLTELTRQAIQEKRPGVAVETYYQPLKNKVLIEGTAGSDYMSLSPKRVEHMEAARARGESVYAALCTQQKGVIRKTVNADSGWVRVKRKKVRTTYVRAVCPPPPVVVVPAVHVGVVVGGAYPVYGYGAYGVWGPRVHAYYRGGYPHLYGGHRPHHGPGPYRSH